MERKFLEELGLEKESIDKVLDENSADIGKVKQDNTTLTAERDGLKGQLNTANTEIAGFKEMDIETIKKAASDWEIKHKEDTEALQNQLVSQSYTFAIEKAVGGVKFSSIGASKAFVADLAAANLPLKDEKLLGFDEYVTDYKKSDPAAFEQEKPKPPPYAAGTGTSPMPQDNPFAHALGLKT